MENSKLVDILKKLNSNEINRLKSFMRSPYFVERKRLRDFAEAILSEYPDFQGDEFNNKIINDKILPGEKVNSKQIEELMYLMTATIYKFFSIENFQNDGIDEKLRLMAELRKRDLNKDILRISKKTGEMLQLSVKDENHYYNQMKFENELDLFYTLGKGHINYFENLNRKAESLDLFYLASKLKLACEILNQQKVFTTDYNVVLLSEVMEFVRLNQDKFKEALFVRIYYKILLSLLKPDEEELFQELKLILTNAIETFPIKNLKDMYGYAQNYCIRKINAGRFEYIKELFLINQKLLETGIIYENNLLSQWDYKNIVSIALRLKEYDWAVDFIQTQKNRIHPDFQEVAYKFNLASFLYEIKEFEQAIKTLSVFNNELKNIADSSFEDSYYNLDSRTLLLKIYFELGEHDPLITTIDAFTLFLKRNRKISDSQKNNYLNLLKYTKKVNYYRQKTEKNPQYDIRKSLISLKRIISSDNNIANLSWLQAQLNALEN